MTPASPTPSVPAAMPPVEPPSTEALVPAKPRGRLARWLERVEDYTRREPAKVLLAVAVAGLIVGRLLRPFRLRLEARVRRAVRTDKRRPARSA